MIPKYQTENFMFNNNKIYISFYVKNARDARVAFGVISD